MPNRISLLVALEGADEGLKRAISSAERSFNEMSATAKSAGAKAAQGMAELKAGTAALGDQLTRARTQLLAFVGVSWATQQVTQLVHVDESTGITQKLATALDWLARNFETVMGWLKVIAEIGLAVLIYRLIPALITAWQLAGTAGVTAAASTAAAWNTAIRVELTSGARTVSATIPARDESRLLDLLREAQSRS